MAGAYGFGMYGMFGHAADPVNFERFCQRVKSIGVDIQGSPYRDFDMQTIVNAIMRLPEDAVVFVFGASLGANNSPVVVHALNHHRNVDGIFGFQASSWPGAARVPIAPNCAFAHEALNPNPVATIGLGCYRWEVVDPAETKLVFTETNDLHPGDGNVQVQDAFLADMKRIMAEAV